MKNEDSAREPQTVTPISREELKAKIREDSLIVVDTQDPGWYEREHLPGAMKADLSNLDVLTKSLADPTAEIAVYCWSESCTGSAQVSEALARWGFSNVRRYVEGKRDWLDAGLPIESVERDYDDA